MTLEVDVFMLQGPPQPFDEDIVHPAAATVPFAVG
jgi:hypothetical protein